MPLSRHALGILYVVVHISSVAAMELKPQKQKSTPSLQSQLAHAIKKNNADQVSQLLLRGAQVKIKSKKRGNKTTPPFHLAAYMGSADAAHALLTSPQGGPQQFDNLTEHSILKTWFGFLCCLHRLKKEKVEYAIPPKEIINLIFSHLMPPPNQLINQVPVRRLQDFKPFMRNSYKQQLIAQLFQRHINKQYYALTQKYKPNKKLYTPAEIARACKHSRLITMLNVMALKNFKGEIKSGYEKLLG